MIKGQTVIFSNPPSIIEAAATVGPKEGEGPLKDFFDVVLADALCGEESWEKAESRIVEDTLRLVVEKAGLQLDDINFILTGDLLNQNTGSSFGVRALNRPLIGLFGACSTMGESMLLGSILLDGGFAERVICAASSHFCAAEKQFRFPLDLGTQRPLTASWTVTGDGAVIVGAKDKPPYITCATIGKVIDMGITDSMNMGAAMAPAAVDTLVSHFNDTGRSPDFYDVIATGDLGHYGKELVVELLEQQGITIGGNYTDCGIEIFDREAQDTHAGGSGCGCSAVTFAGYYYDKLKRGQINRMLLVPTGALMSPTSTQQGESIPGIAHAVCVENILS